MLRPTKNCPLCAEEVALLQLHGHLRLCLVLFEELNNLIHIQHRRCNLCWKGEATNDHMQQFQKTLSPSTGNNTYHIYNLNHFSSKVSLDHIIRHIKMIRLMMKKWIWSTRGWHFGVFLQQRNKSKANSKKTTNWHNMKQTHCLSSSQGQYHGSLNRSNRNPRSQLFIHLLPTQTSNWHSQKHRNFILLSSSGAKRLRTLLDITRYSSNSTCNSATNSFGCNTHTVMVFLRTSLLGHNSESYIWITYPVVTTGYNDMLTDEPLSVIRNFSENFATFWVNLHKQIIVVTPHRCCWLS